MIEGAPFVPLDNPLKILIPWVGGGPLGVALNEADADGVEPLFPNTGAEAWPLDGVKGFSAD